YEINKKLGAIFSYQGGGHARNPFNLPVFGQHIIGDGTSVTHYMNSYIGARANTECFIGEYSAAIVGKTPEYGFHLPENRIGKTLFEVKVSLKDETDWSALGYYISKKLGKNYWDVPVINGIKPNDVTNDELVTFCSCIPAYGAVVHSLLVGISPEALTLDQAFGGGKPKQTFIVGSEEINEVFNTFSAVEEKPDMISVGGFGVNASIDTVMKFTNLLESKKVSKDFPTVITMDGPVKIVADSMGLTDKLRKAGVIIGMNEFLQARGLDPNEITNSPIMSAKRLGLKSIVFTDAKSCHYTGNQDVNTILKHIEECAQIAINGRMEV
ncbi:MAG TPA: aconitase X, partial [Anaerovoracaceae bacterium]|nr:aconitase X [Anaerovoracaceae bacterium]